MFWMSLHIDFSPFSGKDVADRKQSLKGTFFPGFLYFRIWTSLCEWFHLRGQGRERKDKG